MKDRVIVNTRNLLDRLREYTKFQDRLASLTGEKFNVFRILGMESKEVTTHSAFICNLLDPNGTHGKGTLFLKLFLTQIQKTRSTKQPHFLDTGSAKVFREYHIGAKTDTSGGRVDIYIIDEKSEKILIENKIYAGDQPNQLGRYQEHDKKALLLYLTLDGKQSPETKLRDGQDYWCLSYAEDILCWIQNCTKEVADIPVIRESLVQYQTLIKYLTGQNLDTKMNEDISKLILDKEDYYECFCLLQKSSRAITEKILGKLDENLEKSASQYGLTKEDELINLKGKTYDGFYFTTPALTENNLAIGFQFQSSDFRNLSIGICRKVLPENKIERNKFDEFETTLGRNFQEVFHSGEASLPWWPASFYWSKYQNWDETVFRSIMWGDFSKEIDEVLRKFKEVLERSNAI